MPAGPNLTRPDVRLFQLKNKSLELDNLTRRFYVTNTRHQQLLNDVIAVNGHLLKSKRALRSQMRGKRARKRFSEDAQTGYSPAGARLLQETPRQILPELQHFERLVSRAGARPESDPQPSPNQRAEGLASLHSKARSQLAPRPESTGVLQTVPKSPVVQAQLASHFRYSKREPPGPEPKRRAPIALRRQETHFSASEPKSSGTSGSSTSGGGDGHESSFSSAAETFSEDSEEGWLTRPAQAPQAPKAARKPCAQAQT